MASPCSSFLPPPAPLPIPAPLPSSQSRSPAHSPSPESPSMSPKPEILLLPAPEPKPPSPPRKTQPLPWSHQETLALIEAYQEKWYSLKKGPLKASQWDEVAVGVAARCGFDKSSKTANQCRNKIEKLRRRYRFELKSRKPVPSSWQYFGLMYQMECGPLPLDAHPIAYVKLSPRNTNSNATNNNIFSPDNNGDDDDDNVNRSYSNLYSGSGYYYNNNGRRDVGGSDESDEEWNNTGYGVETAKKNKSKSINHIVLDNVKRGVRSARRAAMDRGFGGGSDRFARELRDQMNGKRKQYYGGEDSDDEDDDDDENDGEEDEEQGMQADEGGGDGVVGKELAAEIRGFADMFMKMGKRKIEMIREMERYRTEMEKKRMEMILVAQRKIVDTVGWAFEAHKKPKMSQES